MCKLTFSKKEAIYFILKNSKENYISSTTKLNKILARLNLHLMPINIEFHLNKYGSYNPELGEIESNNLWSINSYTTSSGYSGKSIKLTKEDLDIDNKISKKMERSFTPEQIIEIKKEIYSMSSKSAKDLSDEEHKKLLVDIENREKLIFRANSNECDYLDLYKKVKTKQIKNFDEVKLKGLIEYCFELSKFLKAKIDKLPEDEYDYDENMNTYYYLKILEEAKPFIEKQIDSINDNKQINLLCEFLIRRDSGYPFSIHNENYKDLKVNS